MRIFRLTICFILIIVLCLSVPANATEKNPPLTELLTESQNAGGLVPELDTNRLPDGVPSIEGKPILVLLQLYDDGDFTQYSLEELYDKCAFIEYIVIDKTMTVLTDWNVEPNEPYQAFAVTEHLGNTGVPTFITDILDSGSCGVFQEQRHNIQNVICLRGCRAIFVYYITDGGTFVRVYKGYPSGDPCVAEYSLQVFNVIWGMYLDFYDSDRYSSKDNPSGSHPCAGGHFFAHYISNPGSWHKTYRYIDTDGLDADEAACLVDGISIISRLAIATVVCFYIRDRIRDRKRRKQKEFDETIAAIQADSNSDEVSRFE